MAVDTWKLFNEVKRDYLEKLEDAYSRGIMSTDEYERGKEKLNVRVLQEVSRRLVEMDDGNRVGN